MSKTQPATGRKAKAENTPAKTSKLDLLLAELRRPEGASIAMLATVTGWQNHSVRGALAGTLKKKGHRIISELVDGTRRYRVTAA